MLTRRDLTLVTLTLLTTTALAALAQSVAKPKPPLTSTAIDWNSVQPKPNATGSSRAFIDGPTSTLDRLNCHASTLNPGAANHEILTRPDDEVIIVKEGNIEAYVIDKWVRLGPGSVIFNARNAPQAMRNVGDGPATYHVVSFRVAAAAAQPGTR
jgi:XRE family transcriptional regulator, regulator of sulfur utilization